MDIYLNSDARILISFRVKMYGYTEIKMFVMFLPVARRGYVYPSNLGLTYRLVMFDKMMLYNMATVFVLTLADQSRNIPRYYLPSA